MTVLQSDELESVVMELIINAGQSKSLAMEALAAAKKGEWHLVDTRLTQAQEAAQLAHKVQTQLIGLDEGEGKIAVNLILVHAQDHIMTAMLARELISELIDIYRSQS